MGKMFTAYRWVLNKSSYLLALLAVILLQSCLTMALGQIGVFNTESQLKSLDFWEDREVYMIPMVHVGTAAFYADVGKKVDSLQQLGYVAYLETTVIHDLDSVEVDAYQRKIRKLLGVHVGQYYDTVSGKIANRFKYRGKTPITNQPPYHKMRVNTAQSVLADLPLHMLIRSFEESHGEIVLENCDWDTDFEAAYRCKTLPMSKKRIFSEDYVQKMRNEHVLKLIDSLPHEKVVLIYGGGHYEQFEKLLRNRATLDE